MTNDLKIKFNENKTINAVLYIASKIDRKDFHKIFKVLYFADRNHFADYGRPITGDNYIKMEDGPVPSNLYDIFKTVRGDGYYKDIEGKFTKFFTVQHHCFIKLNSEPNLNHLSKTDLKHLDLSIKDNGTLDYPTIRDKSHDYAWESASLGRSLKFENILRESGIDDEYIDYLKEKASIKQLFE